VTRSYVNMFYFSNSISRLLPLLVVFIWCFNRLSQANECLPQLADTCFKKISSSLDCFGTVLCDDPETFCELLDDSLQCSADIIDNDCSKINGTDKFDSWYKGLRAVYSYMCHPMTNNGTKERLHKIKYSSCWSKESFIKCVGNMLNIHHVVDMLKTSYDYKECIRMVIAMTNCNVYSQSMKCTESQETFINDLVFIFFSQQKCANFQTDTNGVPLRITSNFVLIVPLTIIIVFNRFKQ